jgi:hypothetical protein
MCKWSKRMQKLRLLKQKEKRGGNSHDRRKVLRAILRTAFPNLERHRDGIWHGDAASLAAEFDVSEDAADSVLDELNARRLSEKVYTRTFFISKWREDDFEEGMEPI